MPAALLAGCAAMSEAPYPSEDVVRLDLDSVPGRQVELDGRWVEFDAYVYRLRGDAFLVAVPGRTETSPAGETRTMCQGTEDTNLVVVLRGGLGPLPPEALRTPDRQPRVTIRAIFRNAPFSVPSHWVVSQWSGHVDQATIVIVHDAWCSLTWRRGVGANSSLVIPGSAR